MDLTRFKPGQLQCVKTLDAPLVVSAGAGSGKTFTLTQRLAWALMEGSAPDGGAFLDGIEQVMAITFTEKAAGEWPTRPSRSTTRGFPPSTACARAFCARMRSNSASTLLSR